MKPIAVAVVGTGWCGGIRAETLAAHPLVRTLDVAEVRPERLAEIAKKTRARVATKDYQDLVSKADLQAVYISATPESTHYPMARDFLAAGKHVFLEKPIALELAEADELIKIAKAKGLKFTIGYSQRFNPKYAYVRKMIRDGTIGKPVSALVSRHITRGLGSKISGRIKLSPAAMEATHDLDFVLWCLEPARPVRVYSQVNFGAMRAASGKDIADTQWLWIEMVGTEGVVMVDDSHRDVVVNTVAKGMQLPLSTMPGEFVEHTYAGPMAAETVHFLEAVALDRPVLVTPEHARMVMEVYLAADLSAERNEAVALPLKWPKKIRSVSA